MYCLRVSVAVMSGYANIKLFDPGYVNFNPNGVVENSD